MDKSNNREDAKIPSLWFAIGVISGSTLVANLIAAMSNVFLSPLIYSQLDRDVMAALNYEGNPLLTLLAFLIPSVLSTVYIFPIYRTCYRGKIDETLPLSQRRLLNMPLVLGAIGLCGWLISLFGYMGFVLNRSYEVILVVVGAAFDNIITGSVVFVISYYMLEFFSRKFFIPSFFPQGKLSGCQGTLALSIRSRFYIFYFAVAMVPMFFMYRIVRALEITSGTTGALQPVTILISILLGLGALLAYLLSRSYQSPLVEMAFAAQKIQSNDYAVQISVVSNDEVGNLGEAINEMAEGLKEKEFIKDTFGKVVDPRVRDYLLGGHIDLGGEIREAAILFTDIRDFTLISSNLKPDQVVDWLNRYFDRMSRCIVEEGGIVNKYVGDAILAVFGVPLELPNPTASAVRAADRMKQARADLNKDLISEGFPPIHSGIAIHAGPVLAGNIGSSSRMEYTVIGDTVNIAARMEKLCKEFHTDIILSESALSRLGNDFQARDLGLVDIRGKDQPIKLFAP